MGAFAGTLPIAAKGEEFARLSRSLFGNIEQRFADGREYGRLHSTMAGACRFSEIATSPLEVWVDRVAPRSHDPDFIKLLFQVSGETRFRQAGQVARLTPGTWVLFDPARPYNLVNATMIEQVVVQLPRSTFPRQALALFHRPLLFPADEVGLPQIIATLLATSVRELSALELADLARVGEVLAQLAVAAHGGPAADRRTGEDRRGRGRRAPDRAVHHPRPLDIAARLRPGAREVGILRDVARASNPPGNSAQRLLSDIAAPTVPPPFRHSLSRATATRFVRCHSEMKPCCNGCRP